MIRKLVGQHQYLVEMEIREDKWRRAFLAPSTIAKSRWAPSIETFAQVFSTRAEAIKAKKDFADSANEFVIRKIKLKIL